MLLALHRQVTRSRRPSIAGTAVPLAAAPYRASGLVLWRKAVTRQQRSADSGLSSEPFDLAMAGPCWDDIHRTPVL